MKTAKRAARARVHARPAKNRRRPFRLRLELAIQFATASRTVPSASAFRRWVRAALDADARVTVRLVGLAEGRRLNRAYRGKDYATNVLTFVLNERPPYEGDLVLCAPVVSREAREQGKKLAAHYAHLTVHGVLHLQGHDHENRRQAAAMEKLETRILDRLGLPDPYAPLPDHE